MNDTTASPHNQPRRAETPAAPPWSRLEIWLAAALPGGLLAADFVAWRLGSEQPWWSDALSDAARLAFGPLLLLLAWLFFMLGRSVSWRDLGLRGFRPQMGLLVPLLLVSVMLFALCYLGLLDMYDLLPAPELSTPSITPLSVLALVAVIPICEELFCRGVLYSGMRHQYGAEWAAVLSAAIFAAWHLEPLPLASHFIIGVVLAALREDTGSIWPGVLLHAAWNALIVLIQAGYVGGLIVIGLICLSAPAAALGLVWHGLSLLRARRPRGAAS